MGCLDQTNGAAVSGPARAPSENERNPRRGMLENAMLGSSWKTQAKSMGIDPSRMGEIGGKRKHEMDLTGAINPNAIFGCCNLQLNMYAPCLPMISK